MTTCYLDPEDEITGAIARIRSVPDRQAILVLPAGSRIATSRINFRLLAREGEARGLDVLVVSGEPGARALAISAGLPAYDSMAAAEAALTQFGAQDEQLAGRTGGRGGTGVPESTRVMPTPGGGAAGGAAPAGPPTAGRESMAAADADDAARMRTPTEVLGEPATRQGERRPGVSRQQARPATAGAAASARAASRPSMDATAASAATDAHADRQPRRRRLRLVPLLAVLVVLAVAAGAAYGAYTLLPTATISLRPHVETVGPVEMSVVADPTVAVPDAAAGVVPAQRLELPLLVRGTFPATGSRVSTSRATGTVRFRSENTLFEVPIPAGTRVSTADGVAFETTRAVTVERASFATGPTTADAPVRAVRAGPRGNVDAGAITSVPQSLRAALISVRNAQPTTGGRREEVTVVSAEDYDAAYSWLVGRLPSHLEHVLDDPTSTPRGLTLFGDSATTSPPVPDRPADELVNTPTLQFALALEAVATVLAVNETLVDQLVAERVAAQVPPGTTLHADGLTSQRSAGTVSGGTVTYTASGTARVYRLPDRDTLLAEVRGRSVPEATAIMSRYGTVELDVWPDFIDRLPDQLSRINLTILPPVENA